MNPILYLLGIDGLAKQYRMPISNVELSARNTVDGFVHKETRSAAHACVVALMYPFFVL